MRPQQQNRRMRGRNNNNNNNNNNRRGPNPLTRNYESNGPDVKIRGSAQQIAEKYTTLARDAQSSGDRVMAENYLQHAEHYNRIIAAAQAQMPIQQQVRDNREDLDEDVEEELEVAGNATEAPLPVSNGSGPQPVIEGTPAEVALNQETVSHSSERRDRDAGGSQSPNGGTGEETQQQRRPRRPRRGRGGHADREAAEGSEAGARKADGSESDSPESPGGDAVLATVED
jgi:Domain of unknown function (DUF4167)